MKDLYKVDKKRATASTDPVQPVTVNNTANNKNALMLVLLVIALVYFAFVCFSDNECQYCGKKIPQDGIGYRDKYIGSQVVPEQSKGSSAEYCSEWCWRQKWIVNNGNN